MALRSRLGLQAILEALVGPSVKVYFQPPTNGKMEYPCVLYMREGVDTKFADDEPYSQTKRYQVTVMDRNPDSEIPDKVGQLPLCIFAQHFVAENINHDVFNLYF